MGDDIQNCVAGRGVVAGPVRTGRGGALRNYRRSAHEGVGGSVDDGDLGRIDVESDAVGARGRGCCACEQHGMNWPRGCSVRG